MSHRFASLILMLAFVLSACGGGDVSMPATEPVSSPVPASTLELMPAEEASADPAFMEACKLQPFAFTNVGFGLPNPAHKLPSTGDVRTIVLFVDFDDAPALQNPEDVFALVSPNAEKFFSEMSYGRMNWILEPHFVWLRLSQPSVVYGDGIRSYEGHLQFIQEAVTLADADIDFSAADSVVVMVPPEAAAIPYGPAFGANPGEGYSADGRVFANGVTSGADLPAWGYLWLNHETGHSMGLPDLYSYQFDASNYDDQHRFAGGFGLMGYIDGNAPELFAFERWQMGWLDDLQIVCLPDGGETVTITPIELAGGVKAVMVPVSESKVVVVESRRPLGYDAALPKSGALVYTVDTAIFSGEGTLVVHPIFENDPYRYQSPLSPGESVTVDGVTISVTHADESGDTVQVFVMK